MSEQRFRATIAKIGNLVYVPIPFDPDEAWGAKERHYVSGSIDERTIRGLLDTDRSPCVLPIGAAWIRDNGIGEGAEVEVTLRPDGHRIETIATDIAAAIVAEPEARAFFESVAPFYRNNYIRWVESAKRPETRAARIADLVRGLKAGQKRI